MAVHVKDCYQSTYLLIPCVALCIEHMYTFFNHGVIFTLYFVVFEMCRSAIEECDYKR